jgi:hypothetical protein
MLNWGLHCPNSPPSWKLGTTVTGIEVDREIRRSIDLQTVIVSNGLAGYEDRAPDLVTVQTADGQYHTGLEKRPPASEAAYLLSQFSEYLPQVPSQLCIRRLPAVLGNEHDVVFALPFAVT